MQPFFRYLKKHLFVFIATIIIIIAVDILLYAIILQSVFMPDFGHTSPANMLEHTADMLSSNEGEYSLPESQREVLSENGIWCTLIDKSGIVVWDFELPGEIPRNYSLQDIALMTRGYLKDYPVFVWTHGESLLVAGYPKDSYVKIMSNFLPYNTVHALPLFIAGVLLFDILLLFLAYCLSKRNISRNIAPIVGAITRLSQGEQTSLKTSGDLAEISDSLNRAAEILEKTDTARANWISGVSHDIRTPLSMILGYADRIAENPSADKEIQSQAVIIRNQSLKIKRLIQDLNITSQLEYGAQIINAQPILPAKSLRGLVAEYINNGLDEKYTIELEIAETAGALTVNGDMGLLKRAVENLIQNSINHNPQGCVIRITLDMQPNVWCIAVKDNGKGVSKKELVTIQNKRQCLDDSDEQDDLQHGLGLVIVRQVVEAHGGIIKIDKGLNGGFIVELLFKL